MAKLRIRTGKHIALEITSAAYKSTKLVYIALADKNILYPAYGMRSRIAYVGETKRGAIRVTESAAKHAQEIFEEYGINKLTFYTVSCTPRSKVRTWEKLESALILRFRESYGKVPVLNDQGKNKKWDDELDYFTREKIDTVIDFYSHLKIEN